MTDKSIIFDFIRTPNFLENFNQSGKFNVNSMNGTSKNFEFVLARNCEYNIEECLDNDGKLKTSDTVNSLIDVGTSGQVALSFTDVGGNSRIISTQASDLVIDMGDVNEFLKGVFLRDKTSKYVLAYCILDKKIPVTNTIIIPKSSLIWNIKDEYIK